MPHSPSTSVNVSHIRLEPRRSYTLEGLLLDRIRTWLRQGDAIRATDTGGRILELLPDSHGAFGGVTVTSGDPAPDFTHHFDTPLERRLHTVHFCVPESANASDTVERRFLTRIRAWLRLGATIRAVETSRVLEILADGVTCHAGVTIEYPELPPEPPPQLNDDCTLASAPQLNSGIRVTVSSDLITPALGRERLIAEIERLIHAHLDAGHDTLSSPVMTPVRYEAGVLAGEEE